MEPTQEPDLEAEGGRVPGLALTPALLLVGSWALVAVTAVGVLALLHALG